MHRGTYTTQADVKLGNRRGELALREAELWSATVRPGAAEYPGSRARGPWKLLLLNQFHDILPGSAIHWVYEDTARDHADVLDDATDVVDRATTALVDTVDTTGHVQPVVVFNATAHDRTGLLEIDGQAARARRRPGVRVRGRRPRVAPARARTPALSAGTDHLENERLRVEWDGDGLLTSVYDKLAGPGGARARRPRQRVPAPPRPAQLTSTPGTSTASTSTRSRSSPRSISIEVVERARSGWRSASRAASAPRRITRRLRLATGSRRLDFVTEVDWHERHRFLKVAFPVDVHSPRGDLRDPVRPRRAADAREHVVGPGPLRGVRPPWADLSEAGYGVALLNDCKYGYDVRGNVLRLSLLRAPTWPDPECDRGTTGSPTRCSPTPATSGPVA